MMLQGQALGEAADGGLSLPGKAAQGQKKLILLRLKAGGFGCGVATVHKLADAVAQLGESAVIGLGDFRLHAFSISQCDVIANGGIRHATMSANSDWLEPPAA